jgi:hypothetical protein
LIHNSWNSSNAEIEVLNALITTVSVLAICRDQYRTNYDIIGHLLDTVPAVSPTALKHLKENLKKRNKELFLDFMRSMLQWVPENRETASELLKDPWLN